MKEDGNSIKQTDEQEIDKIVEVFFDLFTNTNNRTPNIRKIEDIFLPNGLLVNNTSGQPEVYDIESFIRPRQEILTNGTLTNFIEKESSHSTAIHGNIAQRTCTYVKSGELDKKAFTGQGKKLMQFIKVADRWLFSSVVWSETK